MTNEETLEVDDGTHVATFNHMYYMSLSGKLGKHACLDRGYWCWKHALEEPKKALEYILWKINRCWKKQSKGSK